MPLTFYPLSDELQKGALSDKLEVLLEAAERYRASILDEIQKKENGEEEKRSVPRDLNSAYNWQEITNVLRQVRELPEIVKGDKVAKSDLLRKLAEVYEVLRGAKMPKLEAVRLALISEANQLNNQVA